MQKRNVKINPWTHWVSFLKVIYNDTASSVKERMKIYDLHFIVISIISKIGTKKKMMFRANADSMKLSFGHKFSLSLNEKKKKKEKKKFTLEVIASQVYCSTKNLPMLCCFFGVMVYDTKIMKISIIH